MKNVAFSSDCTTGIQPTAAWFQGEACERGCSNCFMKEVCVKAEFLITDMPSAILNTLVYE